MNQEVRKQNSFFQTRMNEAKLGAYYTDPLHCKWIRNLLEFPEEKEVCSLEPAIGDGEAIIQVTGRRENPQIHIFGVELNKDTVGVVKNNPMIDECIWGDFITEPVIEQQVFSFCFSNPPYGEKDGKRLEIKFLQKIGQYLKGDAVFVYVIPASVAGNERFLAEWCRTYSVECFYKFHAAEFAKWKQVVIIGRKKRKAAVDHEQAVVMREKLKNPEDIPELPEKYEGKRIKVNPSAEKEVKVFTTKQFDALHVKDYLSHSALANVVQDKVIMPKYISDRLSRPPIMPNAGQMYLMAITGAGQGIVGTEETKDLHLQRGIVENVTENEMRQDENGKLVESVQSFTRIKFNIIENNGKIHTL